MTKIYLLYAFLAQLSGKEYKMRR